MPVLQSRAQARHQARQEAQSHQQPQPESQSPPPQETLAFLNPSPLAQSQPTFIAIPSTYNNLADSPSPGIVIGVVLGTLAGILLLPFLLYSALGFGPAAWILSRSRAHAQSVSNTTNTSVLGTRKGRGRRGSRHCREKHEVRTTKTRRHLRPVRSAAGRNSRPGPVPVVPPQRVVRDDGTLDEVVVIEEHSPPPRKGRRGREARR